MPTQVQFRRGTTAQNNNFTGAAGEITVNTSNNTIRVHDGSTLGGTELATVTHVTNSIANVIDSAPALLDTLNELAAAIGDDPGFYANVASLGGSALQRANAAYDRANVGVTYAGAAFDKANTLVATVAGVSSTNISNTNLLDGIKAVDGSSSGLDADLLDGQDGSYYLDWTNTTNKPDPVITVTLTGDVTGTASATLADVTSNTISISTTIVNNSVTLGTDTTGDYVQNVLPGAGITITGTPGESRDATVALTASGVSAATYGGAATVPTYTVDTYGRLTNAANVAISIPSSALNTDVALGSQTSGAYVANLVAGTGVTLSGLGNEGTTPTIAIGQDVGTTSTVSFSGVTASGNVNGADGRFTSAVSAATLQSTGNVNAAAGRIAGDFSASGVVRLTNSTQATAVDTGALILNGGASIGGNLFIGGNLYVTGTTTTLNSNVLVIDDSLIFLADNSTSDVLDIGIIGTFNNGVQQHTGFVRDVTDATWKLFSNVIPEPNTTSVIDFTNAVYDPLRMGALTATSGTFTSTLSATSSNVNSAAGLVTGNHTAANYQSAGNVNVAGGLFTGSLTAGTLQTAGNVNGNNLRVATNSSLGTVVQGTWNGSAIGLSYLAASTISGISLGNNLNALTAGTGLSGSSYNGSATQTWTLATSGVSASTYGGAATVPVYTVDTYGRLTSASNVAIAISSGAVSGLAASATTDTTNATNITSGSLAVARLAASTISGITLGNNLNALSAGTGLSGSAYNGSATQTWTLASSGVSAATYGGASTVPVYTVDTYGRLTSASNVSIAISAGAVSGLATSATTDTTNATNISSGTLNSARLPTSGVSASTYGSAAIVPVYTVDTYGRLTSASNVSIAISSGAVSGLATSATTDTTNATNITSGTLASARISGSYTGITGVGTLTAGTWNASVIATTYGGTGNASGYAGGGAASASTVTVTDDTSTSATYYPMVGQATSGNTAPKVSSTKLTFNPSSGLLTSTDYNSSSDKRLKKDIKTIEGALDSVNKLRGVTFTWKEGGSKAIGLIAQEVQKVIPDVVTKDDNGYLGIRYTNLIGVLVEAIKEQQDQINDLKKQIEKLNG